MSVGAQSWKDIFLFASEHEAQIECIFFLTKKTETCVLMLSFRLRLTLSMHVHKCLTANKDL